MQLKKNILTIILTFSVLAILIIISSYYYISNKQHELLNSIYKSTHQNIVKTTQNLIKDKLNTTLTISLALAKSSDLQNIMKNKSYDQINYENISKEINKYSKYKNVWIQIVDKNGKSVYRSWTKLKGDNLLFRKDLKKSLMDKDVSSSISVALFNLTLKARTPIFDKENNFLGALEIITHFNSIAKDLKENNINSLVIADKKYKNTLKYPHTNIFIDDYYIANINADKDLINYVTENKLEKYVNIKEYIIENNYLISNYTLNTANGEKLAYIINFLDLKNIDLNSVKSFKIKIIMSSIIALIFIFFSFLIYIYSSYLNKIKAQEMKKQSILDSQLSIIVITNGDTLIDANKKLIEFFKDVTTLDEFKEKYRCICKNFIDLDNDLYIVDKDYEGKNWAEHILINSEKHFRVAMKNSKNEIRHFSVKASTNPSESYIIATFSDITQDIKKIEKDKEKDRLLFQQSKIAAIADILKNIAHQWRQPLSVISTIASGMKIQKELNLLSNKDFEKSCDDIISNTQKLSHTIENFTNFFNKENNINNFSLVEALKEATDFFESIFEKNNIKCSFIYESDTILKCNKNDFSQAILNILDNSIYALTHNKNENERVILIEFKNNILQITDSGNGIDEKIISKILEPYFTTKHQAFGVGLGLYIVNELFVKNLGYSIDIKNIAFEYENKKYFGASFMINFN
jgi:nitrogen-specific signal transduction histidine kinase